MAPECGFKLSSLLFSPPISLIFLFCESVVTPCLAGKVEYGTGTRYPFHGLALSKVLKQVLSCRILSSPCFPL